MNPWDDLNKAMAVNKHLEAENARLKKQLEKALDALGIVDTDKQCPDHFGLTNSDCDARCRDCWRDALEEVE